MPDFAHLHLHTLYSLLDGAIRLKDLTTTVKAKGMDCVAVTDHGNMFGAADFYLQAKAAGVKPIFGSEVYVAGPKGRKDRTERSSNHLVLVAENQEGFSNLRYLASMAYLEGHYYNPRIDKELLKGRTQGLFASTACLGGEVPNACLRGDMDRARAAAQEYKELFEPGHFFLEVQSNGLTEQKRVNACLAELGEGLGIPLVATADAHYVKPEDAKAHEYLMCIASGKTFEDQKRLKHETEELYIKSGQEMLDALPEYAQAIANAADIARRCHVELPMGKPMLPRFQVPDGFDDKSYLEKLAREGLDRRFREIAYPLERDVYVRRLEEEISVIKSCGFAGYFLIVQDFINWAKAQGIPVGPGRGSGAGSLVAYSLRITDLDPIPYKLLFERFLNPERVSMPDFDVDFCQNRRDEVIGYVTQKYGKSHVGQIITFGSLKARSVIRDVVRVRGLPFSEGDKLAKLVPEGDPKMTLGKALELEPRLKALYDEGGVYREILDIALALEGLHRQAGMHAAGVVISDQPLWEVVPLYQPSGENFLVTQFAKDEVEKVGLVKFDFLGLKTLDVIDDAVKMVNQNRAEGTPEVAADRIPLDDPEAYALISRGDTAGVFQFESSGFTEFLKRLKPTRFEDIIAAGAIYRPGPLESGVVDDYIARKHGKARVVYPHPKLEPILQETYGCIVYQEQVMQISQALAGFTLGRADILRRAMGKKKAEEMAKLRGDFCAGAQANGVDPKVAGEIFDLMEKFAGYGFNKSHAAAYALVTVQTAWLKAHRPAEFMAALFSSEADNTDKIVAHIADAREAGMSVLPPSVNESSLRFSVPRGSEKTIRFGLGGVKGVGEAAIEAILEARETGPFHGLFDFCERVDLRRVNRKVVEALVKAGAFDGVGQKSTRRALFEAVEKAVERGQSVQRDRAAGQASLFAALGGGGTVEQTRDALPVVEEWDEKQRLASEKETLGFYISGHPLAQYQKEIRRYASRSLAQIQQCQAEERVTVVGVAAAVLDRMTKTGKRMGIVTLEDMTGSLKVVCFSAQRQSAQGYEQWEPLLKSDDPLVITGAVSVNSRGDEENPARELKAEEIVRLTDLREKKAKRIKVRVAADAVTADRLNQLRGILSAHAGATQVVIEVLAPGESETVIKLADLRVRPTDALLYELDRIFEGPVAELVA
ncbi:MAG TPA: DNA polymerase III subunit alpha [Myxococcales bacterium]|nr:DNA polymerase III subunit alpha [Myxococcales bacterium]